MIIKKHDRRDKIATLKKILNNLFSVTFPQFLHNTTIQHGTINQ